MGVPGLWNLLEPARRPLDLEQLAGRVIAIDMNIWLHQAVKSRASSGGPRGYLTVLFRRLCKLIFYGIRPLFVFDGDVPALKKSTMAHRRRLRGQLGSRAEQAQDRVIRRLLQRVAESSVANPKVQLPASEHEKDYRTDDLDKHKHELLRRLAQRPDVQQAREDAEIFSNSQEKVGQKSDTQADQCLLGEHAGLEYDELARDFLDDIGLHNLEMQMQVPQFDSQSPAFQSLPIRAQLRVAQLAYERLDSRNRQARQLESAPLSIGSEAFSANQVGRLLLRRQLTELKQQLSIRIAQEDAVAQLALLNNPKTSTNQLAAHMNAMCEKYGEHSTITTAMRIQSMDSGHAILIKKSPMKPRSGPDGVKPAGTILSLDSLIQLAATQLVPREEAISTKSHQPSSPTRSPSGSPIHFPSETNDSRKTTSPSKPLDATTSPKSLPQSATSTSTTRASVSNILESEKVSTPSSPQVKSSQEGDIHISEPIALNSSNSDADDSVQPALESFQATSPPAESVLVEQTSVKSNEETTCRESTSEEDDDDDFVDVPLSDEDEVSVECKEQVGEDVPNRQSVRESSASSTPSPPEAVIGQDWVEEDEDTFRLDDAVLKEQADRLTRQAQTTTTRCIEEAQELLRLFGMPFVTSPEEAEAQCVSLQRSGQVDLVASDDSDVWPFGARAVCRHLFGGGGGSGGGGGNAKSLGKAVTNRSPGCPSTYKEEDVQKCVGLSEFNLLQLALLCGSDYTPGIQNVGPVTAMEILSEFDDTLNNTSTPHLEPQFSDTLVNADDPRVMGVIEPLQKFASWWHRYSKESPDVMSPKKCIECAVRKKWLKLTPPKGFPDPRIVLAYLRPNVHERNLDKFKWDAPNVNLLINMHLMRWRNKFEHESCNIVASLVSSFKFMYDGLLGWQADQTENMLRAVLKRHTQRSLGDPVGACITDYFASTSSTTRTDCGSSGKPISTTDEVSMPSKRARKAVALLLKRQQSESIGTKPASNARQASINEKPSRCAREKVNRGRGRRVVVARVNLSDIEDD